MYYRQNKDILRIKNNYKTIKAQRDSTLNPNGEILDENLTQREFEVYYHQLPDTIKKEIKNIKTKNITNVTNIYQNYSDTIINIYSAPALNNGLFDISYGDTCWGFKGYFNLSDTSVVLKNKWFKNDFKIIEYWDRKHLFGKSWLPKIFTKKIYFRKTINNCNSSIDIQKINIGKFVQEK